MALSNEDFCLTFTDYGTDHMYMHMYYHVHIMQLYISYEYVQHYNYTVGAESQYIN